MHRPLTPRESVSSPASKRKLSEPPPPAHPSNADLDKFFSSIQHDPRYIRLVNLYNPKLFTKAGAKNFAKRSIDPANIPVIGDVFKVVRTRKIQKQAVSYKQFKEDQTPNSPLNTALRAMEAGLEVETASRNADVLMSFCPLTWLMLGLSKIPQFLVETAIQSSAVKAAEMVVEDEFPQSPITHANACYMATKAFLVYLGMPKTEDPIYCLWEGQRLWLKTVYGANAFADLSLQQPSKELVSRLQSMEESGVYDISQLGSLLYLLWWVFDCWDSTYYEKIRGGKYHQNKAVEFYRNDEQFVIKHIRPLFDPNHRAIRLDASYLPKIITLLRNSYFSHQRFAVIRPLDKYESNSTSNDEETSSPVPTLKTSGLRNSGNYPTTSQKKTDRFDWVISTIAHTFLRADGIWGYVDDYHRLLAVALLVPCQPQVPNGTDQDKENRKRIQLHKILAKSTTAKLKLGPYRKNFYQQLKWENQWLTDNLPLHQSVLYFCAEDETVEDVDESEDDIHLNTSGKNAQRPLQKLLKELLRCHPLTYSHEYVNEEKRVQLLASVGFSRIQTDVYFRDPNLSLVSLSF